MIPVYMTVSGSPRKDGSSAQMLRSMTQHLDGTFVYYDAYDKNYAPCTDCRACREFEGCVNGDMDSFFEDFESCDGIIIASPIYNMSFPAPLKAILDRMQRYYSARFFLNKRPPVAKRRPVALLLSAGSKEEDGSLAVRQLERIFTVTNCELICKVTVNNTDSQLYATGFMPSVAPRIAEEAACFAASVRQITKSSHDF